MALNTDKFQVLIDEKKTLHKRYRTTEHVLDGIPQLSSLFVETKTDKEAIIINARNKVIFQSSPMKIDFYQDDTVVVTLNAKGLMRFEHLRPKPAE